MTADVPAPTTTPRKLPVTTALIAVTTAAAAATAAWLTAPSGKIVFDPPAFDVLRAEGQGSSMVVTLKVTNDSRQPVVIQGVSSSCGCTVAGAVTSQELKSRGAVLIPITLSLPPHGERTSVVTVQIGRSSTGDTQNHSIPIRMQGSAQAAAPYILDYPGHIDDRITSMAPDVEREFYLVSLEKSDAPD